MVLAQEFSARMAQYPPLKPTKTTTNPTSLPSLPVEGAKGGGGGGESLWSGSSVQDVWQRKSLVQERRRYVLGLITVGCRNVQSSKSMIASRSPPEDALSGISTVL